MWLKDNFAKNLFQQESLVFTNENNQTKIWIENSQLDQLSNNFETQNI